MWFDHSLGRQETAIRTDGTDEGQPAQEHRSLCWQVNIRTDGTDKGQTTEEHCTLCWQVNIRTDGTDEGQPKNTVPYVSR